MTTDAEEICNEIGGFYERPEEARNFLSRSKSLADMDISQLKRFRDVERGLYHKRLKNRISRSIELLRVALDNAPPTRALGARSLGLPAYQAEVLYTGKGKG